VSARRVSLSDLADRQDASTTFESEKPVVAVTLNPSPQEVPKPEAVTAPTPLRPDRQQRIQPAQQVDAPRMRYDEYERKETRLRDDQYGRLTTASRRLNKHRKGRGERITENTLIRVAIDLLLNDEDKLVGVSEVELRKSVGL
jgi:hypothetical protein